MQRQMVAHGDGRFSQVAECRLKLPGEYYDLSTPSRRLNIWSVSPPVRPRNSQSNVYARTFGDQQKSNILAKRVTGADVAPNLQFEPTYSANADLLPRPTYPIASRNSVQPCFPQSRDLS
jgi:hypothetical protein